MIELFRRPSTPMMDEDLLDLLHRGLVQFHDPGLGSESRRQYAADLLLAVDLDDTPRLMLSVNPAFSAIASAVDVGRAALEPPQVSTPPLKCFPEYANPVYNCELI